MKKRYILLVLVGVLLVWIGTMIYISLLTCSYGDEFHDLSEIGFDFGHPWDGEPELRVLSYGPEEATVYYFTETGGEKALFGKKNGQWEFERTLAIWSDWGGSADDYFIWPYFKNYVP